MPWLCRQFVAMWAQLYLEAAVLWHPWEDVNQALLFSYLWFNVICGTQVFDSSKLTEVLPLAVALPQQHNSIVQTMANSHQSLLITESRYLSCGNPTSCGAVWKAGTDLWDSLNKNWRPWDLPLCSSPESQFRRAVQNGEAYGFPASKAGSSSLSYISKEKTSRQAKEI